MANPTADTIWAAIKERVFRQAYTVARRLQGDIDVGSELNVKVVGWFLKKLDPVTMGNPSNNDFPIYDSAAKMWKAGAGSGGTVLNVTATYPIASSGGVSPDISLQNSVLGTVVAAYGHDTGYFTASGGDATDGNVIVGDANGGIKDSGIPISGIGSGTVTSVGLQMEGVLYNSTVTGSPVTTSGTFLPALLTQTKNTILAGPISGSAATPTFRVLVSADLPTTVVGFDIGNGDPTSQQPNILAVRAAGSFTKCVITVTASDPSTDLSFKITQNGVDVFSADPTVAHGTASGTVITYTLLTSSPLPFAAGDKFQYTGLTGTSSWRVNVQME